MYHWLHVRTSSIPALTGLPTSRWRSMLEGAGSPGKNSSQRSIWMGSQTRHVNFQQNDTSRDGCTGAKVHAICCCEDLGRCSRKGCPVTTGWCLAGRRTGWKPIARPGASIATAMLAGGIEDNAQHRRAGTLRTAGPNRRSGGCSRPRGRAGTGEFDRSPLAICRAHARGVRPGAMTAIREDRRMTVPVERRVRKRNPRAGSAASAPLRPVSPGAGLPSAENP